MSDENPEEEIRSELESLKRDVSSLQRQSSFADDVRAVADRVANVHALSEEARRLRGRGWVWDPEWEKMLAELERQGPSIASDLRQESGAATSRIQRRLDQLEDEVNRIRPHPGAREEIRRGRSDHDSLQGDVAAAKARIGAIAEPFTRPYDHVASELKEVDQHLDRFEAAKFQLQPGEHPWLTVDGTWEDAPGGKRNGFLYFSDRRIRFEQKETITTKKWLIFTASSEDKHELLLDEPVGNLASSDDTTRGLVFKDQLLTLKWTKDARYRATTFEVNTGYAKEWDGKIEDLRAGNLGHLMIESAAANPHPGMPIDPPTKCEACGASLEAPVRGQSTLVCRFCNQRHDLRLAPG